MQKPGIVPGLFLYQQSYCKRPLNRYICRMVFVINKLYRDKLVPQQLTMGRKILCTRKTGDELIQLLTEKADEEMQEIQQIIADAGVVRKQTAADLQLFQKKVIAELKDLSEVRDALRDCGGDKSLADSYRKSVIEICDQYGIDIMDVIFAQNEDRQERGGFKE